MTQDKHNEQLSSSGWRMYGAFAAAGVVIGLIFPPVSSFFVTWNEGMLGWFVMLCIAAGITMAMVAAVVVRVVIIGKLVQREEVERARRQQLENALRTYVEFAAEIRAGRLSTRLGERAEQFDDAELARLGRELDSMALGLDQMTQELAAVAQDVTSASSTMHTTAAQHSTSVAEQAAAVSEISTTVEEVRQTAEQAAERAQSVIGATEEAQRAYEGGRRAVETTIEGITSIRDHVESIAKNILTLSEKTQQIGEIVASVTELAEQSNLLAVNASIEAVKAGEHGRGFAVVASEVRTLAQQSKEATRQVRSILVEIQRATNSAVMVTEDGAKRAEAGVKLARETGDTLGQLAKIIENAIHSARQIAAMSRQQAMGVDQVSVAMRNIEVATKDTVEGTRNTEEAARELAALSTRLKDATARSQGAAV